ncbi:MAG TPA: glycosyltransferase family 39 protein [Planctomycetota bacterium]|nr:glycosyltransferase family 39 protein [Planctomycetota bacterium]
MMKLSRTQFIWALLLVAVALRFGAALALRDIHAGPGWEFGADGRDFHEIALEVSRGNGFRYENEEPTSFRAPGFPIALAGVYAIVGERPAAAYVLFALLGALSCVLAYAVVREIQPAHPDSERLARWSGVLCALYAPHVYFATVFASENLFIPCLAVALWCAIRALRDGGWKMWLCCGAMLGVSALVRPFALLLGPPLALMILWRTRPLTQGFVHATVLTLSTIGALTPWVIRNYGVHGQFVLVATNGGSTFYGSNNDRTLHDRQYLGGWISTVKLPGREQIELLKDEVAHDKLEWALGKQWVREHLADMPALLFYKLVRFCLPDVDSPNRKYVLLQWVGATPFLLLMALGMAMLCRREYWTPAWLVLHASTLATIATALIFWGCPRFRDANLIPLMAYAAVGLVALASMAQRVRGRKSASVPPVLLETTSR